MYAQQRFYFGKKILSKSKALLSITQFYHDSNFIMWIDAEFSRIVPLVRRKYRHFLKLIQGTEENGST